MKRYIFPSILALVLAATSFAGYADGQHSAKTKDSGHAVELGEPGNPGKVSRTMVVEMDDAMRFKPSGITVDRGETIRIVGKNVGKLRHELVLGTRTELREHAALMRKFPGMEHADPNQISVAPGETRELVWHFTRAGIFEFACLEPGHFEAGMIGTVTVEK